MSIEEISAAKQVLNHTLNNAIREFEKATGLTVYYVDVERISCGTLHDPKKCKVFLGVVCLIP